ncbi:hypothetical protein AVEN_202345-2-1, partial [Araneus ventricosus]
DRYDRSSTEAGVLTAHHRTTARPLPNEVRTITDGGTQPTGECPQGKRVPAYLSGSNVGDRSPVEGFGLSDSDADLPLR